MPAIPAPTPTAAFVNQLLAIKPLWAIAKGRARAMMVKRAETIGVPWQARVAELRSRQGGSQPGSADLSPQWQVDLEAIQNPDLQYPNYYTTSFHAYDEGNLGWLPAMEVEVAAKAVHAKLWPGAGANGDAQLRQSYHDVLIAQLPQAPTAIVDLGCGVGMSSETLQALYPQAQVTGVDLSPYFLAVAQYRQQERPQQENSVGAPAPITWHHATAEETGLPAASYDLVSACLMFHELPQTAARAVLREAHRLLKPGGHVALMDMNPQSEVYRQMPAFVLTLLKSTEPYLDEYFALDMAAELEAAGFETPTITQNSARHRVILAKRQDG